MAPEELVRLLAARGPEEREEAWATFTRTYSRLLLHTVRRRTATYDASMDRYAYVLEQLRRDDCRRLRRYAADGRGKFTTWLVVVARRLCLDYERQRYGRFAHDGSSDENALLARRRLVDLLGERVEPDALTCTADETPESDLRHSQLQLSLEAVLAQLAPRDRLLLKLRFEDDLSAAAIARVMSFPSQFHVYRRLKALLRELRALLVQRGIRDAAP